MFHWHDTSYISPSLQENAYTIFTHICYPTLMCATFKKEMYTKTENNPRIKLWVEEYIKCLHVFIGMIISKELIHTTTILLYCFLIAFVFQDVFTLSISRIYIIFVAQVCTIKPHQKEYIFYDWMTI